MQSSEKALSVGGRTIDAATLMGRTWSFGRAAGEAYATQFRLLPGGRVGGYVDENETWWDIRGETLVLCDVAGRATTMFDTIRDINGMIVLEGPFVPTPAIRHRLTETRPLAHLPDADQARRMRSRANLAPRRNLVVMRANDRSLHKEWPRDIAPEDRNWDLALSWYGNPDGFPDDPDAQHHVVQDKEGKWTALWKLLYKDSPVWNYDYVMFPDDDLAWSFSGINLAFEIARQYNLLLAQASLGEGGYIIHEITRQVPETILRFTSFVEVMAPILSNEALRICGPTFGQTNFGFGIDHIWPKMLGEPRNRIAIIDATSFVHTRPQGQSYAMGPAIEEGQALSAAYKARETYSTFGSILRAPILQGS